MNNLQKACEMSINEEMKKDDEKLKVCVFCREFYTCYKKECNKLKKHGVMQNEKTTN
jgi:hypothetical protein